MTGPIRGLGGTVIDAARYLTRTSASFAADLANASVRIGEAVTGAVTGTKPTPATLKLSVLILSDENGVPLIDANALLPAIERANGVLLAESGIRVRHVATHTSLTPAPMSALNPRSNKKLLLDEVLGRTEFYHQELATFQGSGTALDIVGRPITAVVVRNIAGNTTGCSLGISANWVVVQASLFNQATPNSYDETVLVHELGHACNLPHHPARDNLMFPTSSPPGNIRGTALNGLQRAVLHANRHVVPGLRS